MFCTRCGADIGDNPVCLQCGQPAESDISVYNVPETDPAAPKEEVTQESAHRHAVRLTLAGAMSSPLLMAAGILLILTAVLSIIIAGRDGRAAASLSTILSVLKGAGILAAVFAAKKRMGDYIGEGSGLLRVMLMIDFVLGWVGFGCICLLLVLLLTFRSSFYALFDWIVSEGGAGMPGITLTANGGMTQTAMMVMYWAVIGILAAAAILLFFWTLYYQRGKVVMGRDVMTSLREGHFYVSRVRAVRGWSLAAAIIMLISGVITVSAGTLSFSQGLSPVYGVVTLMGAATYFLIFRWVDKYFIPKN